MMRSILVLLATLCTAGNALAASHKISFDYTITVDAADLSTYSVQMRIRGGPPSFVVAAHAHPEYDDKYWRYLEGMRADGAVVTRLDSVRWQITNARDDVTLHYRIRPAVVAAPRAAWRAFLTPNGGIVGGPHSFLYVVGHENEPASVTVDRPAGWTAVSGMNASRDGRFIARDIFTLMESPIMIGKLREWTFDVANTPHHIFYLPGATPVAFDTTAFISSVQKIVQQTLNIFIKPAYERYVFMFSDDAWGGLEHPNSATLGAPSADLAKNPHSHAPEIAHEFFHTWNLMRFKPIEYRRVDYRVQPPVAGLWFSEGLSIFYSDLMLRRAGFTMPEPTRIAHLAWLLGRYADNPGNQRFSAEQISRTEYNSTPGALGNFDPSSHLVGEVLGAMLDFIVRDKTNGARNMDHVMRGMNERHADRGFNSADIERVVADVCGCSVKEFFDRHVRGASVMDVNRYLEPLGLRAVTTRVPATLPSGEAERDLRIRAYEPAPQDTLRLLFWTPESIWVRAGLNTNDRVLSVNGVVVRTWPEFRTQIAATPMGGSARIEVVRAGQRHTVNVTMSGYERTTVSLEELPNATERQRRLREQWLRLE